MSQPCGISVHGDSVYLSCWHHTVNKLSVNEMCLVRRIGGKESNNGLFSSLRQLTTDYICRVLITDYCNNRICNTTQINYLRIIAYQSLLPQFDVKVSRDLLYVLCPYNNREHRTQINTKCDNNIRKYSFQIFVYKKPVHSQLQ